MLYTKSSLVGFYCPHVAAYVFKRQHNNPHPKIGDHSGMVTHVNDVASPMRGSICLASPDMGRFWGGAYISEYLWNTPPHNLPPEYE